MLIDEAMIVASSEMRVFFVYFPQFAKPALGLLHGLGSWPFDSISPCGAHTQGMQLKLSRMSKLDPLGLFACFNFKDTWP